MPSKLAAGCFLVVLAVGILAVLLAAFPTAGRLLLWGGAAVWLPWYIGRPLKSVQDTDDPSPPPLSDPSPEGKPQFTAVPDPDNDHRTIIVWSTETEDQS